MTATSFVRMQMAAILQQQLRQVGVDVELARVEGPVWLERRSAGDFDIDFSSANQDPSPSGLAYSWSCDGPGNVGGYCDPVADSLLDRAIRSPTANRQMWHDYLRQVEETAPAAFLYGQTFMVGVHRRFRDVTIRPGSPWGSLWRWSVPES